MLRVSGAIFLHLRMKFATVKEITPMIQLIKFILREVRDMIVITKAVGI